MKETIVPLSFAWLLSAAGSARACCCVVMTVARFASVSPSARMNQADIAILIRAVDGSTCSSAVRRLTALYRAIIRIDYRRKFDAWRCELS